MNSSRLFFSTTPVMLAAMCLAGCGGGLPLLHSAHVLPPGRVAAGAGLSGQIVTQSIPTTTDPTQTSYEGLVQDNAIAPTIAPWVSARVGIEGSNEAGLAYTGRAIRLDGRHSFALNKKKSYALSIGLGGELLLSGRQAQGASDLDAMKGGGIDVPILFGWRSTAGLYSAWIGPRPGITWVQGSRDESTTTEPTLQQTLSLSARDIRLGFVAGLSVGFRQVHVAMELGGAYHFINATVNDPVWGTKDVAFNQFTLTPAGALVVSF